MRKPVALIILDGWGINENCQNNAVCQAQTPRLDELAAKHPTTWLNASGLNVGLPDGQMGNSEVGHLNIGAGRIVYQELTTDGFNRQEVFNLFAQPHVDPNDPVNPREPVQLGERQGGVGLRSIRRLLDREELNIKDQHPLRCALASGPAPGAPAAPGSTLQLSLENTPSNAHEVRSRARSR